MKRRDILKLGLAGLVGLERLTKAIAGETLQQPEPTAVACEITAAALPVPVNCQPTPGGGYTLCGADNQNVTCYGVNQQASAFDCTNYSCNRNFVCEDFTCFQGSGGDFNCNNSFNCDASDKGAQFHCQGSDFFTDQFNCYAYFRCNPNRGQGQRFYCDDFHCAEGNFWCYVQYNGCTGTYSA
jgi:hypothetical protein